MNKQPTIDECLRALPLILNELREVRRENAELRTLLRTAETGELLASYDVGQLKARGYGQREAYAILRRYGARKKGRRWRITLAELIAYEQQQDS